MASIDRKKELTQVLEGYRYLETRTDFTEWSDMLWSWVEDRIEAGFRSGFVKGVRALEKSAIEEGYKELPAMDETGISLASDDDWNSYWQTLGVERIYIGRQ